MNKTLTYTYTLCLMALSSLCFIAPLSASTIKIEKLVQLGCQHNSAGNYSEAENDFKNVLKLENEYYNKLKKENANQLIISLCRSNIYVAKKNLGNVLCNRNKFEQGAKYLEEALIGYQEIDANDHPAIPEIKKNLGVALATKGSDKTSQLKAKGYLIDALSMQEKNYNKAKQKTYDTLKEKEETLASCLAAISETKKYLGDLLKNLGDYNTAAKYLKEALIGYLDFYGDHYGDHLTTAQTVQSLGTVGLTLGYYNHAESLLRVALKMHEHNVNMQKNPSPHARLCMNSIQQALANLLIKRHQYEEAQKYLKAIIATPTQPYHKAEALQSLGHVLRIQGTYRTIEGNYKAAKGYYKQSEFACKEALTICNQYYPNNHLDIAKIRIGVCHVWACQGDLQKEQEHDKEAMESYKKAKIDLKKAMPVIKEYYGDEHLETAKVKADLGNIELKLGSLNLAYKYFKSSFAIIEQNLGADHIETNDIRTRFVKILIKQGDYENALIHLKKALAAHKEYYGDNFETARLQKSLGDVLVELDSKQEALTHFEAAYKTLFNMYGKNHHRTADLKRKCANVRIKLSYDSQKELRKAEQELKEAKAILEQYYKQHNYRKTKKILDQINQDLAIACKATKKKLSSSTLH